MTSEDSSVGAGRGRRRKLDDELALLRRRTAELREARTNAELSPESSAELRRHESRIAEIDEELARLEIAEELERQQDA